MAHGHNNSPINHVLVLLLTRVALIVQISIPILRHVRKGPLFTTRARSLKLVLLSHSTAPLGRRLGTLLREVRLHTCLQTILGPLNSLDRPT